jgi:5-methylthioadenosine/S-adenosylhomocysteine deaminase
MRKRSRALVAGVCVVGAVGLLAATNSAASSLALTPWDAGSGLLIEGATVVTMDDQHTVLPHGRVLVRDGRIAAVWTGPTPPGGGDVDPTSGLRSAPQDLLFPGLINAHSHPNDNFLATWLPPSSHAIPEAGKAGTEPYANRYQWRGTPSLRRLVANPRDVLGDSLGLGLHGEIVKYAEVAALLGGETAIQGASPDPESDGVLIRNIDNNAFDGRIAEPRIESIVSLDGAELANLQADLRAGAYDAWLIHLAEGVRDGERRPGDPVSSRAEFDVLKGKGLLTSATVVIHGTGLERTDFAEMSEAGADLVWSPLSNLLLYGTTTNVYEAMAEGVTVSLGTDWTPSGSRTLLRELKVADIALRDQRILAGSRDQVAEFAIDGTHGRVAQEAEEALDRALVDMVTRNPARTLGWYDRLGSIEAGKIADLVLLRRPDHSPAHGLPRSEYRDLIDATERDVRLVLVGGEPLAGEVELLAGLKPGDFETVASTAGGFAKAVDVTTEAPVPSGGQTLAEIEALLEAGLAALGGDHPPAAGGPGPVNNTYSYLKAHVSGGAAAALPDPVFRGLLAANVGTLPDGSLNLERVQLLPLFADDDDFLRHILRGELDAGLVADSTPPFALYPANLNFIGPAGNPLLPL